MESKGVCPNEQPLSFESMHGVVNDPGPSASKEEKARYFNEMRQYGLNVQITRSAMEMNSPEQQLINMFMNDRRVKEDPTVLQSLPLLRSDRR